MTKQDLIDFETEVAEHFNAGRIRAPVHLSGGNEDQLIELFQRIKPHDYVFSTWRSHYHALLHGVPREQLMAKILKGESITISVPERKFYSSAICGGCLPIALGVAWGIRYLQMGLHDVRDSHVCCFVGDMAAMMGAFAECQRYAVNHKLPITFVIEDNRKCVNANTRELWAYDEHWPERHLADVEWGKHQVNNVLRYVYQLAWPHMGTGKFVEFSDDQKFQPTGGM